MTLSFLEANRLVTEQNDLKTIEFVLAASSQTEKLDLFIKACGIQKGFNCNYSALPFNTLSQHIYQNTHSNAHHVFFLLPWDLVPYANWRTGLSISPIDIKHSIKNAEIFLEQLSSFGSMEIVYLAAPIPPLSRNRTSTQKLEHELNLLLLKYNTTILPKEYFSLTSYLANGCPIAGIQLYYVADAIVDSCTPGGHESKKVLVTDFDNVLWKGVIGEDGIDGINCSQEGAGYPHYFYQSYLRKLKQEGVLIAGVTRNDEETAHSPFKNELTLIKNEDFVSIIASYNAKSAQIESLSKALNLPLTSFVFIDDNPIEIEEVKIQLPEVTCLLFPKKTEELIHLVNSIQLKFHEKHLTDDDHSRTEMYRARNVGNLTNNKQGADLTDYLQSLEMAVSYSKCHKNNYQRALQLINKTNQFNLNGKRIQESELVKVLENKDTSLYTFSLNDKYGEHGQVCCALIQNKSQITHLVLSCRVFQRKLEHAALLTLFNLLGVDELSLDYIMTERNIPLQMFISDSESINQANDDIIIKSHEFEAEFSKYLNLFNLSQNGDLLS